MYVACPSQVKEFFYCLFLHLFIAYFWLQRKKMCFCFVQLRINLPKLNHQLFLRLKLNVKPYILTVSDIYFLIEVYFIYNKTPILSVQIQMNFDKY